MNKSILFFPAALAALFFGCGKQTGAIGDLANGVELGAPIVKNLRRTIPAYGVVIPIHGKLEIGVNIEAEDSPMVRKGEAAFLRIGSSTRSVRGHILSVVRAVSSETRQSLAWLKTDRPLPILAGQFARASIVVGALPKALTVPRSALLVKNGKSYVIARQEGSSPPRFFPIQVETGIADDKDIQISRGLSGRETLVTQGALGFLYPSFKSSQGD